MRKNSVPVPNRAVPDDQHRNLEPYLQIQWQGREASLCLVQLHHPWAGFSAERQVDVKGRKVQAGKEQNLLQVAQP